MFKLLTMVPKKTYIQISAIGKWGLLTIFGKTMSALINLIFGTLD
jgi:hypothetical protein